MRAAVRLDKLCAVSSSMGEFETHAHQMLAMQTWHILDAIHPAAQPAWMQRSPRKAALTAPVAAVAALAVMILEVEPEPELVSVVPEAATAEPEAVLPLSHACAGF